MRPVSENTLTHEKDNGSLLKSIRNVAKKEGIDFYAPEYPSNFDYYTLMNISMAYFSYIFELVRSKILLLKKRSSHTCLAMLIAKFRSGLCNSILFTLFNKRKLIIHSVQYSSQDLIEIYVPLDFGM